MASCEVILTKGKSLYSAGWVLAIRFRNQCAPVAVQLFACFFSFPVRLRSFKPTIMNGLICIISVRAGGVRILDYFGKKIKDIAGMTRFLKSHTVVLNVLHRLPPVYSVTVSLYEIGHFE